MRELAFPEYDGRVKRHYYDAFYSYVFSWAVQAGISVKSVKATPEVWCGRKEIHCFSCLYDGRQLIFDYADSKDLHVRRLDEFREGPLPVPVFKFHLSSDRPDHFAPNLYPFVPLMQFQWRRFVKVRREIRYTARGSRILNNQRAHGNAKKRRGDVHAMLRKRYAADASCGLLKSQEAWWRSHDDCLVAVAIPGQREDILDRGQWEEMGLGVCVISPPLRTILPGFRQMKPWVHYVPLALDFHDLYERIEWCREHREECVTIGDNARALFHTVAEPASLWGWVEQCLGTKPRASEPLEKENQMAGNDVALKAEYKKGRGRMGKLLAGQSPAFEREFGMALKGTVNLAVKREEMDAIREVPGQRVLEFEDGKWLLWLCELSKGRISRAAWCGVWDDGSKSRSVRVHILSRAPLPAALRKGKVSLEVYGRWSRKQIAGWAVNAGGKQPFLWYQTFGWGAPRADKKPTGDSALIWHLISKQCEWAGRTVLDIGCHTGYHCFEAAKAGAVVTGFDVLPGTLRVASEIGRHIEGVDVDFAVKDPGRHFDIILHLSVQHQADPTYRNLSETLEALKARCEDLFLELLVPPRKGSMTTDDVHRVVGVEPLLNYRHRARGVRSIYHLKG